MKNDTINKLKSRVGKKNAVIVYSGTLAIESALLILNIGKNDKVLIASSVCYSVVEAILRVGAIPVVVAPKNGITLEIEDLEQITDKKSIKCIILVHQYGIGQLIKTIKNIFTNIPIIEDIAQAWDIKVSGDSIGKYSDIVVTSFGKTKPLSLGYGGALFSNNNLSGLFDYCDCNSRDNKDKMLPYYLQNSENINFENLVLKADKIVSKQRKVAYILSMLSDISYINFIHEQDGDNFVWHRFPIVINNRNKYNIIIKLLEKNNVKYQLPHDKELFEIPLLTKSKFELFNDNYKKLNIILIRTRNNKIKDVKKFVNEIMKLKSE